MRTLNPEVVEAVSDKKVKLSEVRRVVEKELYALAMKLSDYNQSRAATALGVSRGTLRAKLISLFGDKYISKVT